MFGGAAAAPFVPGGDGSIQLGLPPLLLGSSAIQSVRDPSCPRERQQSGLFVVFFIFPICLFWIDMTTRRTRGCSAAAIAREVAVAGGGDKTKHDENFESTFDRHMSPFCQQERALWIEASRRQWQWPPLPPSLSPLLSSAALRRPVACGQRKAGRVASGSPAGGQSGHCKQEQQCLAEGAVRQRQRQQ